MSAELKFAENVLNYPYLRGISVDRVDNISLRYGGDIELSLAEYRKRDIPKVGIWIGETFKEYIR